MKGGGALLQQNVVLTPISEVERIFEQFGLETRRYNHDKQLNIKDLSGIWHSFYPTTGTMVFNKFDDISKKYREYDITFTALFAHKWFCNPDNIQNLFKEA